MKAPTLLTAPRDGVPPVIADDQELAAAADRLAAGTGPVALDAERASGYRYSGRAYLVQLRRAGSGTFLVDPTAFVDLSPLQEAIGDSEWVLHAATQDLPCLAEVGMHPHTLFDTELGSRLAGLPRVGLAAVVEHYLGVTLAKEHSAVDWSTRPLPEPWLAYAALDVEVLVEVRNRLSADLAEQGKLDWAMQDFEALLDFTGPPVREEPWRRISGIHKVRDRRALARARELWKTRDEIARQRDVAPGRIIPDAWLVALVIAGPTSPAELQRVAPVPRPVPPGAGPDKATRAAKRPRPVGVLRYQRDWLDAIRTASSLSGADLPTGTKRGDGPPPVRAWADRDPLAAARYEQVRQGLQEFGEAHSVPLENLVQPDALRRLIWNLPESVEPQEISDRLSDLGARPWQRDIATPLVAEAVTDHPATDE